MADEKKEIQDEQPEVPEKKTSKAILIIVVAISIVLGAGGFVGYKLLKGMAEEAGPEERMHDEKTSIIALDPFVLKLADRGRYLKVAIQFVVTDMSLQTDVKAKTPQLRDTIITLVSSKSLNSISSPEGKFQLKDEVLFSANQIMGMDKEVFKNLYFTEFVMQ